MVIATTLTSALITGLTVSATLCFVLILTQRWHGMLTADDTLGIQKVHTAITPRVGGFGIFLGVAFAIPFLTPFGSALTWLVLIAALPAWIAGLAEDLTDRISTRIRLLATTISAALAWWLTGYTISSVDIPIVDQLLSWTPLALLFTLFSVAGVAHAINIIDGFNGLASGTVLICLIAFGLIASNQGDVAVLKITLLLIAAVLGFFILNYPFGKIFLGDGGAYALGFFIAWIAVMLASRHADSVSPWAFLLICSYPVLETVFSMLRRLQTNRRMDHPDRTHLHSLIFRRVIPRFFPNTNRNTRNALTAPLLWAFAAMPAAAGVYWQDNTMACLLALVVTTAVYMLLYRRVSRFSWF